MRCYICDQQGKESPAVAICVVCGMGLCRDHAIREELSMWETVHQGPAPTRRRLPQSLPRFLCPPCQAALQQTPQT